MKRYVPILALALLLPQSAQAADRRFTLSPFRERSSIRTLGASEGMKTSSRTMS